MEVKGSFLEFNISKAGQSTLLEVLETKKLGLILFYVLRQGWASLWCHTSGFIVEKTKLDNVITLELLIWIGKMDVQVEEEGGNCIWPSSLYKPHLIALWANITLVWISFTKIHQGETQQWHCYHGITCLQKQDLRNKRCVKNMLKTQNWTSLWHIQISGTMILGRDRTTITYITIDGQVECTLLARKVVGPLKPLFLIKSVNWKHLLAKWPIFLQIWHWILTLDPPDLFPL